MNAPQNRPHAPSFGRYIGGTIFFSRWLQAPLYLGLIVAQVVYVAHFGKELNHLISDFNHLSEADIMLIVLGLVDVVMIANLLIMVIIGGYETFVSRIKMSGHPDQPEWLSHVNPNVLKVKLAMSIIGISSVHLLKTFIEAGQVHKSGPLIGQPVISNDAMMWQTIIHLAFIASAVALAYIDWLSQKSLQLSSHAPGGHGPAEAPAAAPAPAPAVSGAPVAAPAYATAGPVAPVAPVTGSAGGQAPTGTAGGHVPPATPGGAAPVPAG